MLEHGGNLHAASQSYQINLVDWLDLSTGINPNGWPVPDRLPAEVWSHLPIENDGLIAAAQYYYHCDDVLAVAGSQAAIQSLPRLRSACRVGIITPAYAEHAHAWQQAGHTVIELNSSKIDTILPQLDVLIIINPNNPTGELFSPSTLLSWHTQLAKRGGWLIVDEAFMDVTPNYSVISSCPLQGLIVLCSIGKFFGLAGLRVGFVIATPELLKSLADILGPWPIAQASRYLAKQALKDTPWQQQQRQQLPILSHRLHDLLLAYHLQPSGSCALFQWVITPHAKKWHRHLAQQGIFSRLFTAPPSLRFGLPKTDADWHRLKLALGTMIQ